MQNIGRLSCLGLLIGSIALAGCAKTRSGGGDDDTEGGVTGFTGFDGTAGTTGSTGSTTTDGTNGTDGTGSVDGTDGTTGTDATSAVDGNTGTNAQCASDSDCPAATPTCAPQGVCILCYPATFECQGDVSMECGQFGEGWEVAEDCGAVGSTCNPIGGKCSSACGGASVGKTNAGCSFIAIDLENALADGPDGLLDAQNANFAVIASNTSATATAQVTITAPNGQMWQKDVAPNSLETFNLPPTYGLKGTGKSNAQYRVVSNTPITAYQFNPLDNEGVFSNDASVLLPTSGVGTEYYVATLPDTGSFKGYFAVAPTFVEGPTTVTITPTTATEAGGLVLAMVAGQEREVTVSPGDVLHVRSASAGGDLTGTHITSDRAIVVMSGHVAAVTGTKCCADHLEQQMAPVATWDKEYVIGRSMERGNEPDYFVVVAQAANTQVTVFPSVTNPSTVTLGKGQKWSFTSNTHVRISANQPVMVAQFLASSQEAGSEGQACVSTPDCPKGYDCGIFGTCDPSLCFSPNDCGAGHTCVGTCTPIGDPALILAVPSSQWQKSYVFLSPDSYIEDYVNVVIESGGQVVLDGGPFPASPETIGNTSFVTLRAKVNDGQHRISADKPFSITVYGYDRDVSYGYPGGLGLTTKN